MILGILLLGELITLHLISRRLTQTLYALFFRLFRNKTISVTILVILLFPGTVVHELAHLFVAEILRVRTGKLTLIPEGLEGKEGLEREIRTGSVAITETDPLRRTLIGLAPVYMGIAVLAVLSYFIRHPLALLQGDALQNTLVSGIFFYLLFTVSNSMFSSSEDMKGVIPFTITVALFAVASYIAGFRVGLSGELLATIILVIQTLVRSLGMVLGVNLVALATTFLLLRILSPRKSS